MVFLPSKLARHLRSRSLLSIGLVAGLAGGAAEVVWILFYMGLTGGEAAVVARGVTATLGTSYAGASWAISVGIAIHMALAIGLGIVIVIMLRAYAPRLTGTMAEPFAVVGILIAVWAMNFFVVLPMINPEFVGLVPYGASLASKVLFGASTALVMHLWPARQVKTQ